MTWFQVDDTLATHPKARRAGLQAMGLWVVAGAYAGQHLTDGFVPRWYVETWPSGRRLAQKLVQAGLWVETCESGEPGWRFHQWEERQMTKEEVEERRRTNRERQAKWREEQRRRAAEEEAARNAVTDGVTDAVTNGVSNAPPIPTQPNHVLTETETPPSRKPTRAKREGEWMSQVVEARRSAGATDLRSWSSAACANAVQRAAEEHEVTPDVAWQALVELAAEADTQHPGRLTHQLQRVLGNVWNQPKPTLRSVDNAPPLPEPCGECGPSRRAEGSDGEDQGPCVRCHPSRLTLLRQKNGTLTWITAQQEGVLRASGWNLREVK